MRNVWKGLMVGGLTGVTAGVVLDAFAQASKKAAAVSGQVREHAPEAGRWIHSLTDRAGEWLHEADVPEHVRGAVHRMGESDAASRVTDAKDDAMSAVHQAVATHGR